MNDFIFWLLQLAAAKCETAGYNGEYHDGGARALEEQVEVYKAGMLGKLPKSWESYHKAFLVENDPEYEKYLELREKFG